MSFKADFRVQRPDGFTLELDVEFASGATVALLGPNGAGKSTFVEVVAGLLAIDHGELSLNGRLLDDGGGTQWVPAEERRVGIVFQDYLLFPHMTVEGNVVFGLPEDQREAAGDWLTRLGIDDLAGRRVTELSGGQMQKVALARALCRRPDLLVLDEPLAALDATSRVEVRRDLSDVLEGFPGPSVLITHDATEAFLLADTVHVIEDGVITQSGTADDIRISPRTKYAADLAGANLFQGSASGGTISIDGHELHAADTEPAGDVLAIIQPRAISIHVEHPEGSPRNVWRSVIRRVEHYGDRVRLSTGPPLEMTAEITPAAVDSLGLSAGDEVWVSIKATEISLQPA